MVKIFHSAVISIIILSMVASILPAGSRAVDYGLFIPDCEEQYHSEMKVMVAGVEHNLTFQRTSENITVIMYSQGYLDGIKNESTYYRWRYFNGIFYDMEYGKYINRSSSSVFSDRIAFHIGIYSRAEGARRDDNGAIWHMMVRSGEETIIEDDIFVEKARASLALSTPDFEFRAEPFSSGVIGPSVEDYSFRTKNTGNIPLFLTGEYDKMADRFETTNMSIILRPGEEVSHDIYLKSLPWSPRVFSLKEHVKGMPLHIMQTESINFIQAPSTVVNITVKVVRPGFNIIDIGRAKLQYEQGPKVAEFNEVLTLRLFLTGNGTATLTINPERLLIKGVYYHGIWHNTTDSSSRSMEFYLNESQEEEIRVSVQCYKESVNARLNYRISAGNKSGSAYTEIVVGKAPEVPTTGNEGIGINSIGLIIAAVFLVLMFSFVMYHRMKMGKTGGREKDKNEKEYRPANRGKKRNKG